jgi:dinuclear metal center YbgI/SA1388 family protein
MPTIATIATTLEELAPLSAAEEWDNVGLLVGDRGREVTRLMTCLTLTPVTTAEAIAAGAELVVVHHPLPFRPLSRITTDTTAGQLLWDLIGAKVAVYSSHTAFDSARDGINEQWAARLGLEDVESLVGGDANAGGLGSGRCGRLASPCTLSVLAARIKAVLNLSRVRVVGTSEQPVTRVAVACGSGGAFLDAARLTGCDCLVTGEANFHACLEAEANQIGLILCGHFASERFAMEQLASELAQKFPDVKVWASRDERDPIREM